MALFSAARWLYSVARFYLAFGKTVFMIRYALECANEHVFEEWFDNMADFDSKAANGALSCPDCGDSHVHKTLMAPSIGAAAKATPATPCGQPACASGCPALG